MFVIQIIFIATIFTLWSTIFACQSSQLVPPISTFPVPADVLPMQRGKLFASALKESGQQHFDKDEEHLFNETMELIAMNSSASNTTTLAPSLIVSTKMGCTSASVTAVTNQSYNEHTVQADYISLVTKLGLLETFLQVKLSSFGQHVIQPISENGNFAMKIVYSNVTSDCVLMQDFAAKTVSYSKEVEKAIFNCKCGDSWLISKIH